MVSEYTGYQIVPYDPDAFPLIQQGTLPPGVELLPNEYLVRRRWGATAGLGQP